MCKKQFPLFSFSEVKGKPPTKPLQWNFEFASGGISPVIEKIQEETIFFVDDDGNYICIKDEDGTPCFLHIHKKKFDTETKK